MGRETVFAVAVHVSFPMCGIRKSGHIQYCTTRDGVAGQSEVRPNLTVYSRKEVAGSDVGAVADFCLRHGKQGLLGCDPELGVHSKADASAHYRSAVIRGKEVKN